MSFVAHGMGIVPGSAAPDTSLSIRERIVADIVTTLESIRGPALASKAGGSSHGPSGVAGGTYTGLVTRRYQVLCSLAGASGVAEVTVTDETTAGQQAIWDAGETTDDGPADLAVTSGVAFAVGTLGATCTLTFDALEAGDAWLVDVGAYRVSIERVMQSDDGIEYEGAWARLPLESEDNLDDGPVLRETLAMEMEIEICAGRSEDQDGDLRKLLTEAKRALWRDPTRGGIALDTAFRGSDGFALRARKPRSLGVLRMIVLYRTTRTDPRVL